MEQETINQVSGAAVDEKADPKVDDRKLRLAALKARIERAQLSVSQYIEPGRSLADELIAERREAAKLE
jgi:hypothetical protein